MDADRWQRISRLYHEALARPVDERGAFLHARCQSDEALRREVASLLAREDSAEVFLESPAAHAVTDSHPGNSEDTHSGLQAGAMLGVYRLERPLGHRGMGAVFLAHDPHFIARWR